MGIGWKSARAFMALVSFSILCSACQRDHALSSTAPSAVGPNGAAPSIGAASSTIAGLTQRTVTAQGSTNGSAGQMPAYYEGRLFTVNMKEMPETASDSTIENNRSVNEIYASNDLDDEQDFIPVIDAIQGEGFNPLWRQILIVFNPGFTPHQFTSAEDVEAAAAGANPEITLVETDEVYRCSVVGAK